MANYLKQLINRNPRNLERLRYARKNLGFQFEQDAALKPFYYKINYEASLRNVIAQVVHYKDGVVLSVSTADPDIAHFLPDRRYRNYYAANENLGRILANRCLKSGINFVNRGILDEEFDKAPLTTKAFYKGLIDGGLSLEEPSLIEPSWELDKRYHFVVQEMENYKEQQREFVPPPEVEAISPPEPEKKMSKKQAKKLSKAAQAQQSSTETADKEKVATSESTTKETQVSNTEKL